MQAAFVSRLGRYHKRLAGLSGNSLAGILGDLMPPIIVGRLQRASKRKRVYTPLSTFWEFLSQVLSPGQPCRETVRRVQASLQHRRRAPVSSRTGGYCRARRRIPLPLIGSAWTAIATDLAARASADWRWKTLRVGGVDGSSLSAPDTPKNQRVWPQSARQTPGCGFPLIKLVAVFSLATGAIHAFASGSKHRSEQALLHRLWPVIQQSFDLLIGDRHFCSYGIFCELNSRKLHGLFRLHQARHIDWRRGRRLSKQDRLFVWKRPSPSDLQTPQPSWPASISIRVVRVCVPFAGFRTKKLWLATDLLDAQQYPPQALAELFLRRWRLEVFFAHIKTTMKMDILRCQTPPMIRREIHTHLVAYNAIRALMLEAAVNGQRPIERISYKGTCDALRAFTPVLAANASRPRIYRAIFQHLLLTLATDYVRLRRPRSEPRAIKRRPKNYHLLNKPRALMGNLPHRNRQRSAATK